jgi:chromosome partitioning protein
MIVLVVTNHKGGVGKTQIASLIADFLAKYRNKYPSLKKKKLIIDLDGQCNLSSYFLDMKNDPYVKDGMLPPIHPDYLEEDDDDENNEDAETKKWDKRSSIANLFFGEPVVAYSTHDEHIDILPGHGSKLQEAEAVRRDEIQGKIVQLFADFVHHDDLKAEYDMVIIDTGPSKGPLTRAALRAATHILIPAIMEKKCVEGIYGMLQLWAQENYLRSADNQLKLIGILPNKYKANTSLHKTLLEDLKSKDKIKEYILPVELPDRIIFAETDFKQSTPKTVFDLPDNDKVKQAAKHACELIMEKITNEKEI